MLTALKFLAAELAETLIRPRIDKAKADLKLTIVTATVLVIFSLMGLICLYLAVFIHLSETMAPEFAALALFGFSVFMCLGALAMYVIGRRVEQTLYERRARASLRAVSDRMPGRDDIDIAGYMQHIFADNKGAALIAAAVTGIVLGAKPGLVLRSLGKIVTGGKSRDRKPQRSGHRRDR
jgi:hypothetical protein